MKIAIHHREGSFSDRWLEYCREKNISYKIVNAFDNDIVQQLNGYDVLMWHHHHAQFKDVLTAKRILFAIEHAGVKVFPNFKTGWHFDDKVGQKYLLEAIGAPLVPSYVFYDKQEALQWAKTTNYPKVFKLKGGASSANVKLVKSHKEANSLISKAFGKGFAQYDRIGALKERLRKVKEGKEGFLEILKGVGRLFITTDFARQQPPERGYAYFQDFVPNNNSDIRVVVIGGKFAAAEKRLVREGDFRASGSGKFDYTDIDIDFVKIALEVAKKLELQSVAFDFLVSEFGEPQIVEISYGFGTAGIERAPGYWDAKLNWHEGKFNPQEWMVNALFEQDK